MLANRYRDTQIAYPHPLTAPTAPTSRPNLFSQLCIVPSSRPHSSRGAPFVFPKILPATPWVGDATKCVERVLRLLLHLTRCTCSLDTEIAYFSSYISPTIYEHSARGNAVQAIQNALGTDWDILPVNAIGSFATKTYLPDG